jgi:hypothetical protein
LQVPGGDISVKSYDLPTVAYNAQIQTQTNSQFIL